MVELIKTVKNGSERRGLNLNLQKQSNEHWGTNTFAGGE